MCQPLLAWWLDPDLTVNSHVQQFVMRLNFQFTARGFIHSMFLVRASHMVPEIWNVPRCPLSKN